LVSDPESGVVVVVARIPAVWHIGIKELAHGVVSVRPMSLVKLVFNYVARVYDHFHVVGVFVFDYPAA
jgi:hypothetical protein